MTLMTSPLPTPLTLEGLKTLLREPFAPVLVTLWPFSPMKGEQGWRCLALPYAEQRAYEDRLNTIAFAHWSTTSVPLVAGNLLIVAVTLTLCGISRTDYGEASLLSPGKDGMPATPGGRRHEDHAAALAYAHGFRRACVQFGLGRFLDELPTRWVPYDPQAKAIALSPDEKRGLVEQMYQEAGVVLSAPPSAPTVASSTTTPPPVVPIASSPEPRATPPSELARTTASTPRTSVGPQDLTFIQEMMQALSFDANRTKKVLAHYQVATLAQLSTHQADDLIERLCVESSQEHPPSSPASSAQCSATHAAPRASRSTSSARPVSANASTPSHTRH